MKTEEVDNCFFMQFPQSNKHNIIILLFVYITLFSIIFCSAARANSSSFFYEGPKGIERVLLVNNKSFASQVISPNTIYEIQYNYDLSGTTVRLPDNVVLFFVGGSVTNGIIVGSHTKIYAPLYQIFGTDIKMTGSWSVDELHVEWFGAKGDDFSDDTKSIQAAIDNAREETASGICKVRLLHNHTYKISNTLRIPANMRFGGDTHSENSRSGWFRPEIHQTANKNCIELYGRNYATDQISCRISLNDLLISGVPYANNNNSGIVASAKMTTGISQMNIDGVCFQNWRYGINIDVPICLSVELSNISTVSNTVGIGITTSFSKGCWGMSIKDSYISFTRIGGIIFKSDGGITGPLNITNTYIESCGNEYSLDTYNTFGCFGLKIETQSFGGLVNIDNCYFESNCPTRSYKAGSISKNNRYGLVEKANPVNAKERYIYISNPDFKKTAELIINGKDNLTVNVMHSHFSVNSQTVSINGGGMLSMVDCNIYRPGRNVDELFQNSIVKIYDPIYSCQYIGVKIINHMVSSWYMNSPAMKNITKVIELMDGTSPVSGRFNIDYQPTGEHYQYYRYPTFYYGEPTKFFIDARTTSDYRNGLIFNPFASFDEMTTRFAGAGITTRIVEITLLSDIHLSSQINMPSGCDYIIKSADPSHRIRISGSRLIFHNSKVIFQNVDMDLTAPVILESHNSDISIVNSKIIFKVPTVYGVLMSSGHSNLVLQSCTIEKDKRVEVGKCKVNTKQSGAIYTELINCNNVAGISFYSDD